MPAKPRKLSLVKFVSDNIDISNYPFKRDAAYVFLGELVNMPGHCVVAEHPSGSIISGYHTENFVELTDDEI